MTLPYRDVRGTVFKATEDAAAGEFQLILQGTPATVTSSVFGVVTVRELRSTSKRRASPWSAFGIMRLDVVRNTAPLGESGLYGAWRILEVLADAMEQGTIECRDYATGSGSTHLGEIRFEEPVIFEIGEDLESEQTLFELPFRVYGLTT